MSIARILRVFFYSAVIFSSGIFNAAAASDVKSIKVAGITGMVPLEFYSSRFGPSGIYVDLWNLWSEKTGIAVSYTILPGEEAERALLQGGIDIIMGYRARPDTLKQLAIIPGIYTTDIYIYRNRKIPSVETLKELQPYRVGVMKGDASSIDEIHYDISFLIEDSVSGLFRASEEGEINLFLAQSALANYELATHGKWKNFVQSSRPLYRTGISAAVRSDNRELLQLIDSGFRSITETERLVIEKSWSGGNVKYRIPWGYIASIAVILAVICGVIVIWWWNFQLQRKVDEATEDLKAMKEEAEAANLAKSRFLDNISHELRTPLTLILAPVESAISGKLLGRETLEMIRRNSRNLLSLINDLLDLSRITAGKMKLRVSETDLCTAVKLYCAEMESVAEFSDITLTCTVPEEPLNVFIDRGKFSSIISNFFSNSLKFTDRGGRIDLVLENGGKEVILRFSDNGSGIPRDRVSTIFDRFSQAEATLSRRHEGTGIGLSIVKEIAELHGGSVSVQSRYVEDYPDNHGTDFFVCIPAGGEHLQGRDDVEFVDKGEILPEFPFMRGINKPGVDETGFSDGIYRPEAERPSILVVEDNADMRFFIEGLLEENYEICTASNGQEALGVLDSAGSVDLIISDVMMPVMDGHELLKRINSDERFSGIPVLFLTARNDDLVKHQGLELGAVDYVVKPFNPEELLLRVRNHMLLSVMRNELRKRNEELCAKLKSRVQADSRKHAVTDDMKVKMDSVCSFIEENFRNDITREMIAATIGINADLFSRVFNQQTGSTLSDFINSFRVEEAKKLLRETGKTVSRVAIETGFENLRTFNRVFRKFTGTSPSEFREGGFS